MNTYTNEELLNLQDSLRGDSRNTFANDPAPAIQAIALLDTAISLLSVAVRTCSVRRQPSSHGRMSPTTSYPEQLHLGSGTWTATPTCTMIHRSFSLDSASQMCNRDWTVTHEP
jgi:hypothetical protein